MSFVVETLSDVPQSEYSVEFIQRMINYMGMSYFKYGKISAAYPNRVNALQSLELRLRKYSETGNTEYLVDVANFAMIEFMYPSTPSANFRPTDAHESPGRVWHGEIDPNQRKNSPESWTK